MPKRQLQSAAELLHEELKDQDFAREYAAIVADGIGRALREARSEANLTQSALAELLGLARSRISQIEASEGTGLSLEALNRFAVACGYRVKVILENQKAMGDIGFFLPEYPELMYTARHSAGYSNASEQHYRTDRTSSQNFVQVPEMHEDLYDDMGIAA